MFLSDQGCLLRKADSGERHTLLVFFLREHGLKTALARRPTRLKADQALPDLFESGHVSLRQKDAGGPAFLNEFTPDQRFPEIARSYRALQAACQLARFFERNLLHLENFAHAWGLLHKALRSMAAKPLPEAALFKALFLFARDEGYPVVADWLRGKAATERDAVTHVLQATLEQLDGTADPALLRHWIADLYRFFERSTDLLPPET